MRQRKIALTTAIVTLTLMMARIASAAPDLEQGKAVFAKTCQNCHSTEIGVNKIGPSLWGVVGRKPASVPDFNYSSALKIMKGSWNAPELDRYLSNPRGTVHGVKMYFKGLPDASQRADVIQYLTTLK